MISHITGTTRILVTAALVAFGSAAIPPTELQAQDSVEVAPLAGATYLFRAHHGARFTNQVVSAGRDGLLMVDMDGDWRTMKPHYEQLQLVRDSLAALGSGLRFLLNTHWHGDHAGGNEPFGRETVIVAHQQTRARLTGPHKPWWAEDTIPALQPHGWPVVTFRDSLTIHFNEEPIRLWNFGMAHTEGDAVIFFERSRVVHLGDLFHGIARPSVGGDMEGIAHTLEQTLLRIPEDTRVVTGHGPVTDVAELRRYHELFAETLVQLRALADEGVSADSAMARAQRSMPQLGWSVSDSRQWLGSIWRTVTGVIRHDS